MEMSAADLVAGVRDARAPTTARFDAGPNLRGRIVVLPSAFNPPTTAHFELLRVAAATASAAGAATLLTTRNVDKDVTGASLDERVAMLLAEHRITGWFAVLATNQARIIDQAAALRESYPAAEFDFVVGYDTLVRLFDTKYYAAMEQELAPFFERSRVVALNRGDAGLPIVQAFVERQAAAFAERIVLCELAGRHALLSSTLARASFAGAGDSTSVPAAIAAYIREHHLYGA